jgi:hypothetical protein
MKTAMLISEIIVSLWGVGSCSWRGLLTRPSRQSKRNLKRGTNVPDKSLAVALSCSSPQAPS